MYGENFQVVNIRPGRGREQEGTGRKYLATSGGIDISFQTLNAAIAAFQVDDDPGRHLDPEDPVMVANRTAAWNKGKQFIGRLIESGGIIDQQGRIYYLGTDVFGDRAEEIANAGVTRVQLSDTKTLRALLPQGTTMQAIVQDTGRREAIYGNQIPGVTDSQIPSNNMLVVYFVGSQATQRRIAFARQENVVAKPPDLRGQTVVKSQSPLLWVSPKDYHPTSLAGSESSFMGAISNLMREMYILHSVPTENLVPPSLAGYIALYEILVGADTTKLVDPPARRKL